MNASPSIEPQTMYHSLFEGSLIHDPDSAYYQAHFCAAAKRLQGLMGAAYYNTWFDRRFPGDGEGSHYTWREKFEAAEAAYTRINGRAESHRGAQIARELNVRIEDAGGPA